MRFACARQDFNQTFTFQFRAQRNGSGLYNLVTTTSSIKGLKLVASNFLTNNDHTTEYTGGSGDLDEKIFTGTWADATNNAIITDAADGLSGQSGWSSGSPKGLSVEGMFMLREDLAPGEFINIRLWANGTLLALGSDITPQIQVGRRIYNTS